MNETSNVAAKVARSPSAIPNSLAHLHPRFVELEDNPLFLRLTGRGYCRRKWYQPPRSRPFALSDWKTEARQGRLQEIYLAMTIGDIVDALAGYRLAPRFNLPDAFCMLFIAVPIYLIFSLLFIFDQFGIRFNIGLYAVAFIILIANYPFFIFWRIPAAYRGIAIRIRGIKKHKLTQKIGRIKVGNVWWKLITHHFIFALMVFFCAFIAFFFIVVVCRYGMLDGGDYSFLFIIDLFFLFIISFASSLLCLSIFFSKEHLNEVCAEVVESARDSAIEAVNENIREIIYQNRPDGSW